MERLQCTRCPRKCVKGFTENYTRKDIQCPHGLSARFKDIVLKPMVNNNGRVRHS